MTRSTKMIHSTRPFADKPSVRAARRLLPALLLALAPTMTIPALAAETTPPPAQSQPRLTFPPASDCTFLGGDAAKRCEARRAGSENEYARVRSGEIKLAPGVPSSSGGTFTPLSSGGSLGGFSSSGTIAPSEGPYTPPVNTYSPNSIGNPWAGTPYSNGTGLMPR